jgi:hypothetical protein
MFTVIYIYICREKKTLHTFPAEVHAPNPPLQWNIAFFLEQRGWGIRYLTLFESRCSRTSIFFFFRASHSCTLQVFTSTEVFVGHRSCLTCSWLCPLLCIYRRSVAASCPVVGSALCKATRNWFTSARSAAIRAFTAATSTDTFDGTPARSLLLATFASAPFLGRTYSLGTFVRLVLTVQTKGQSSIELSWKAKKLTMQSCVVPVVSSSLQWSDHETK